MDGLKRQNPPFAPKTEKGDAEIRRSPYGGPDVSGGFGDDMRLTEKSFPGADLFGMAISPSKRSNSKPEAAALLEVLKALRAHPAVAWCEHNSIPYRGVPVGTIKKHATGRGNADKAAMFDAMRSCGHAPGDDNESDALALLHWALATQCEPDRAATRE